MAYWKSMEDVDEKQLAIEEASDVAFAQGRLEDAKRMLKKGFDPVLVADITEFPIEQVKALR